ncbi:MAG: hypothetical protein CMG79_19330 [Marinobacter sp.]|nr:hypothetical protein [Marinobacter sp.]
MHRPDQADDRGVVGMSFPEYPEYVQSGFHWIGAIPSHWELKPLKFLTECLDGKRIPLNSEQRSFKQGDVPYWGANAIMDYVDEAIFDENLVLIGEDGAPFLDPLKSVAFFSTGPVWPNNHIHVLRPDNQQWAKFLVRSLNATDYANFIDGATRQKLTQSRLMNIPICWPADKEREKITSFLARISHRSPASLADCAGYRHYRSLAAVTDQ